MIKPASPLLLIIVVKFKEHFVADLSQPLESYSPPPTESLPGGRASDVNRGLLQPI